MVKEIPGYNIVTHTREEAIKLIKERDMEDRFFIADILMIGFKGYENYSNEELAEILQEEVEDWIKVKVID